MANEFLETPRFPDSLRFGTISGGPEFKTVVIAVDSGDEQRDKRWENARGEWQAEHGPHSQEDTDTLINFFRAVKGSAHGFRFRDWSDYAITTANGKLGTGVGTGLPTYQIRKVYSAGVLSESRIIKKPISGTIIPYRNATPVVQGASAGQYSVDTTTGIITFVADATSNATAITVGATTQVTLTINPGTLVGGKLLYLTGFTGADAALVNDLAHTINSITGTGPYVFTLSTNTAGKVITLGSGQGRKYPQVSDVLTIACEFDVPVRFTKDKLSLQDMAVGRWLWNDVSMRELKNP